MAVRHCAYCGSELIASPDDEPPVRLQITEGNHSGKHNFCGINCLAYWCDDAVAE